MKEFYRITYFYSIIVILILIDLPLLAQNHIATTQSIPKSVNSDCKVSIESNGYQDWVSCNGLNYNIVANDIIVSAGLDLILDSIEINMVVEKNVLISSITVWVFYDEWGLPFRYSGYEMTSQTHIPNHLSLVGSENGMDFYEVSVDIDPIVLRGINEYDKRYWIGVSAITSDSSEVYWELSESDIIGQPAAYSTGSWFSLDQSNRDCAYTFYARCDEIKPRNCSVSISSNGFQDGLECNGVNNQIVANDIIVPAGFDLKLDSMLINLVAIENVSISTVTTWVFYDQGGHPYGSQGDELISQTHVPKRITQLGGQSGVSFYEVVIDLDSIILQGNLDEEERYWIGISAITSDSSTIYWEISDNDLIGQPVASSNDGAFVVNQYNKEGTYIFYSECSRTNDNAEGGPGEYTGEVCNITLNADVNFSGDGVNIDYFNNRIVANDIIVRAGTDKTLTAVMPRLILESGDDISGAEISVYKDNGGIPGEKLNEQLVAVTSYELDTIFDDKEVYDVLIEIEPVLLTGIKDEDVKYWIGISAYSGSPALWEVSYENKKGYPTAISTGGDFMITISERDGVYTFFASCTEIGEHTGPNGSYCAFLEYGINQVDDATCFGMVSTGGILQSFKAINSESAGVGVQFTDPSRGLEVTLSLWDKRPNRNGTLIASKTTYTYGDKWVDVFWDEPVNLEIGKEYFISIDGDDNLSCVSGAVDPYQQGQSYSGYLPFSNYDLTFRTYYCNNQGCTQTDGGQTGRFQNGTLSSKDQENLLATDITVPIGKNFVLENLRVFVWVVPGADILNADITFYKDSKGKPGKVIKTTNEIVPSTIQYFKTEFGYDMYIVDFDIQTQVLKGKINNINTYWISLNFETTFGSAYMSLSSSTIMGNESYNSPDSGSTWEKIVGWETAYKFMGLCEPIVKNPCKNPKLSINQALGTECISAFPNKGIAQSFTATVSGSAGASIKFIAPSNSFNVTLSLWDSLPSNGGAMLASKTTQTVGHNWVTVYWDQIVNIDSGKIYFLTINGDPGLPCISGSTEDIYHGGNAFSNTGYEPFPDFDYNFKIFKCKVEEFTFNCKKENPIDYAFETGAQSSFFSIYRTANDLTVEAGENFTLTGITTSVITDFPLLEADLHFYTDNSASPAQEIGRQLNIPVTSQKLIGVRNNLKVYRLHLHVDSLLFKGNLNEPTTYWVEVRFTNLAHSANVYWLLTSSSSMGHPVIQSKNGGVWDFPDPSLDGVYIWEGDCEDIETTDIVNNVEFSDFNYYPNPVSNKLIFTCGEKIEKVAIYNLFGQECLYKKVNATHSSINTTQFTDGLYLLKVWIKGESKTFKFIKVN